MVAANAGTAGAAVPPAEGLSDMTWSSGEGSGLAAQVRQQRFSLAMRGYAVAEVDGYLDELAEGLERLQRASWHGSGHAEPIPADLPTADRIREQTFTVSPNGYAMIEVDVFLDDIIEAISRAWSRLDAVPALPPSRAAPALPAPAPPTPPTPQPSRGVLRSADIRAVEFPRSLRGYARKQVDDFLEHAAETLDRLDAALSRPASLGGRVRPVGMTAADVQRAGFFTALRGYAMPSVDDFLDRIAEALAARDEQLATGALGELEQPPPADAR
jgi:DivIVA domain-containing protein